MHFFQHRYISLLALSVFCYLAVVVHGIRPLDEDGNPKYNLSWMDAWLEEEIPISAFQEATDLTSYLPPGWTEEKFNTATAKDLEDLPIDVLLNTIGRCKATGVTSETLIEAEIAARRALANAARLEAGLPALPERSKTSYVKIIEDYELGEWGYVVYRTGAYGDDARWEQFMKRWQELVDEQVDPALGDGVQMAKDRLRFKFVEDKDQFEKASMEDIAMHYQELRGESLIPEGLDHFMCLLVDEASIASVLDGPATGQTPFVQALAVDDLVRGDLPYAFEVDPEDAEDAGEYHGYFQVAISALLHDLYPIVGTAALAPHDIAPLEGRLYKGLFMNWIGDNPFGP
ncbi:MAG: hypothetical protein M4579_006264 [Chaenotheca gracillima]|nr:MAG: hypothetical protein M4579_006264 [Chaenotheca gracillima]